MKIILLMTPKNCWGNHITIRFVCLDDDYDDDDGYSPGRIYSMYFLDKYTSNEALGLSFIGRTFLEKIHEVYSPGRITRFQCSPGE